MLALAGDARPPQPSSASPDARDALFQIIYRKSFGRKDIVLSSGKPSTFYFDMKPAMLDPMGASLIADAILNEVVAERGEFIGGLEMGAVPITGAILCRSALLGTPVNGFFVRKKAKEHGAKKLIEGIAPSDSLAGKRIVIFDDVTTSGESAMLAAQACREEGATIVLAISIVDREEGAGERFSAEGIKFTSLFRASEFLSHNG